MPRRTQDKTAIPLQARLAQSATEFLVKEQKTMPIPPNLPTELHSQCACYVFILESPGEHIRVSYGHPLPKCSSLAQEIINHTTRAATGLIRRIDLPYLRYRVATFGQLQRVAQPEHLDPYSAGLYLQSDRGKSAMVLPQRVGIETAEDQIATAIRESDIDPRQESLTMYRVSVTYYE